MARRARIRGETRQGGGAPRTLPRDELPAPHACPCCSGQPGRGATRLRALQKSLVGGARCAPVAPDRGCVSRDLEILTTPRTGLAPVIADPIKLPTPRWKIGRTTSWEYAYSCSAPKSQCYEFCYRRVANL